MRFRAGRGARRTVRSARSLPAPRRSQGRGLAAPRREAQPDRDGCGKYEEERPGGGIPILPRPHERKHLHREGTHRAAPDDERQRHLRPGNEEAERQRLAAERAADQLEQRGHVEQSQELSEAAHLERASQRADQLGDALDPEENA